MKVKNADRSRLTSRSRSAPTRSKQLWPLRVRRVEWRWTARRHRTGERPDDRGRRLGHRRPTGRTSTGALVGAASTCRRLPNNSAGDGRGHGTFVAGIAAGCGRRATRVPRRSRTSCPLDVMNDNGIARTSDVIARLPVDAREQGSLQHPDRELLAALGDRRATSTATRSTRLSRSSGSAASSWSRLPATTAPGTAERRAIRAGQRSLRDHRRRGRPRDETLGATTTPQLRGRRTAPDARRLHEAGRRRSRPVHGRAGAEQLDARRRSARTSWSHPATSSSRAPRSRPPSSPARQPRSWPSIRRTRRTRSRARSWRRRTPLPSARQGSVGVGEDQRQQGAGARSQPAEPEQGS